MIKNDAIGGYFELANMDLDKGNLPVDGICLNSARNALEYILLQLPKIEVVYLPIFTCDAVLEPLNKLNVRYKFYHINYKFEIDENIELGESSYIVVNNYYGIKDDYVLKLSKKIGDKLIIDNAQALFSPMIRGVKSFYSPRKFIGVADGGIAVGVLDNFCSTYDVDTTEHDSHLLLRKERGAEFGFGAYQENEKTLCNQPIRTMSLKTRYVLSHLNYNNIVEIRRKNYSILNSALCSSNELLLPKIDTFKCPMVFPYKVKDGNIIREKLRKNRIYVARYWANVSDWCCEDDIEVDMSENIIPLPIDQRYGEYEMNKILEVLNE